MAESMCRDPAAVRRDRKAVLRFANRCQVLAGKLPVVPLVEGLRLVSSLRGSLPGPRTAAARAIIAGLVSEVVLRVHDTYAIRPALSSMALAQVAAARRSEDFGRVTQLLQVLEAGLRDRLRRDAMAQGNAATSSPVIIRAMDILRQRSSDPDIRLRTLARWLGVSESRCGHLMKERTGFCFRQHLQRLRVAHAQHLLRATNLSVKEIAATVGYGSASRLDRHFKHAAGVSPGLWRRYFAGDADTT